MKTREELLEEGWATQSYVAWSAGTTGVPKWYWLLWYPVQGAPGMGSSTTVRLLNSVASLGLS